MQLSGSPRLVSDGQNQNQGRDQGDSLGEDAQLGKELCFSGLPLILKDPPEEKV